MRKVTIPVYNHYNIELFVEKLNIGFELWAVGIVGGKRILIDHRLTRDDLETQLEYVQPRDLTWHDATRLEIPNEKHRLAVSQEEPISRGVFSQGVRSNLFAITFLDRDKKDTTAAKKLMLGSWSDGVVTFNLEPKNKLEWSCADLRHWLNVWGAVNKQAPNWWNFSSAWEFHLMADMNTPQVCGTHVGVIHVDEKELRLRGGVNRIALVFRRQT